MIRSLVLTLLLAPLCAIAQITDSRLPITLDAEYGDVDGKSSMVTLKSLRLSQGALGIEADEGRASELNFNDSVWELEGNVVITVENGRIECETADLEFSDNELRIANITGAPATFELTRQGVEDTTYAEAGLLRYDLRAGVIEFSENAKITEGGNQIASDYLVYNISEQRIKAQGSSEGDGKVKITFTPSDETDEDAGEEPDSDASEGEADETAGEDAPE
ncbi:MAG: LptA/OstA family protein [Woeseiaceae bacterium]|nr:LptA/OstA family protein [Woeseiaceae bacterium]